MRWVQPFFLVVAVAALRRDNVRVWIQLALGVIVEDRVVGRESQEWNDEPDVRLVLPSRLIVHKTRSKSSEVRRSVGSLVFCSGFDEQAQPNRYLRRRLTLPSICLHSLLVV